MEVHAYQMYSLAVYLLLHAVSGLIPGILDCWFKERGKRGVPQRTVSVHQRRDRSWA